MSNIFSDSYTNGSIVNLEAYNTGYKLVNSYTSSLFTINGVCRSTDGAAIGYNSAYRYDGVTMPSADYSVSQDFIFKTLPGTGSYGAIAVLGRIQGTAATYYRFLYDTQARTWILNKKVAGASTTFAGPVSATYAAGDVVNARLVMDGNQISGYVNDVLILGPVTDTSITAAGQPGFYLWMAVTNSDTTGVHLDNFSVDTIESGAVTHSATGVLSTSSAVTSGAASRTAATITHTTTGGISSGSAVVSGSSAHSSLRASTGALSAAAATVVGAASRAGSFVTHSASGVLSASEASVSGASSRFVAHASSGSASASSAVVSASSARAAAGQLTTDILTNNTNTPLVNTAVGWSWLPIGRIGALAAITPIDGTGTTDSDGRLTVSGLIAGAGILLVAQQNSGAEDDDVFYQAGTVT